MVIVENNQWSLGTKIPERRRPIDLGKLTASLGVGYELLKGNDVLAYEGKLQEARKYALGKKRRYASRPNSRPLGDTLRKKRNSPRGNLSTTMRGQPATVNLSE